MSEELDHIDASIAGLEAWRDQIDAAIETLRHLKAHGISLPAGPGHAKTPAATSGKIEHDTFFQMTIPDAAAKYLGMMKRTKPNPELAEALLKGGLKTAAKNFPENVRTILSRDDRFVKVNSEWGLAEWYPAMRKERKGKNGGAETPDLPIAASKRTAAKKPSLAPGSVKAKTVDFLDRTPGKTYNLAEVVEALGTNKNTQRATLKVLYKAGLILRPSEGRYQSAKAA